MTREQIEAHLEQVRSRRMLAAMEYHQGQQLKFIAEQAKIERRMRVEYERLSKDLEKLDALDEKIQARMNKLTALLQETQVIEELL